MIYVKDIMSREVKTISSKATVYEAASAMARFGIGSLVVMSDGELVGILTEGDVSRSIARNMDPNTTQVVKAMSKPLVVIGPDARVEEAAKLMAERHIKKLPVVEDGRLVGIVTQTDIVASSYDLVTTLKEMVLARYRPPDFQP
ncbi:MAG: CBS domain-containing protein [Conexivisphaerales archaeon]